MCVFVKFCMCMISYGPLRNDVIYIIYCRHSIIIILFFFYFFFSRVTSSSSLLLFFLLTYACTCIRNQFQMLQSINQLSPCCSFFLYLIYLCFFVSKLHTSILHKNFILYFYIIFLFAF